MAGVKRKPFALYCDDPSLTKQGFGEECDINCIVDRARNGADLVHVNARVGQYGDFSSVPSFQDALDLVHRANGMFMSLDASVRERFGNDPGRMVAFLQDVKNRDEAIRLGLVLPKVDLGSSPDVNTPLKGDVGHVPRVSGVKSQPKGDADFKGEAVKAKELGLDR